MIEYDDTSLTDRDYSQLLLVPLSVSSKSALVSTEAVQGRFTHELLRVNSRNMLMNSKEIICIKKSIYKEL